MLLIISLWHPVFFFNSQCFQPGFEDWEKIKHEQLCWEKRGSTSHTHTHAK